MTLDKFFTRFSAKSAKIVGRPLAFLLAVGVVGVWGLTGPLFHFSSGWQLVINTGTTIVTFLMVFLIQNEQNRDSAAIQAKLDELIRSHSEADNFFVGIEHLTDRELETILRVCEDRARRERALLASATGTLKRPDTPLAVGPELPSPNAI